MRRVVKLKRNIIGVISYTPCNDEEIVSVKTNGVRYSDSDPNDLTSNRKAIDRRDCISADSTGSRA
jgi:hypothetical protein